MKYYIKTKDLEELTELEENIGIGDNHYHKGVDYIVTDIRIVEPNEGKIVIQCKEDKRGAVRNDLETTWS